MRIQGQPQSATFTRQVELPRPDGSTLSLTIAPLPLGFHARLRARGITPPRAPTRVARDSSGQPVRDGQGLAVLMADEGDATYQNELERYHGRVAVLVAAEALQADPKVEFETPRPGPEGDWRDYADRLHRELEEAGWAAGDLIRLCNEVGRISNLLTEHAGEAGRNFSQAPGGATS